MAMIGLASDDSCWCSYNTDSGLSEICRYFGTSYLRTHLKQQGKDNLRRLMYEIEEALSELHNEEKADNPYYMWDKRQDKIERDVTRNGVFYTVMPTSAENSGVYGEVIEWMNAEGWPVLGDVEFLDDVDHPLAKDSNFNTKKFPPNTIKFRLKDSSVKKTFEDDFKYRLGPININM